MKRYKAGNVMSALIWIQRITYYIVRNFSRKNNLIEMGCKEQPLEGLFPFPNRDV